MMDYAEARKAMVDCQVRPSDVTSYAIIEAMLEVPREEFVPASRQAVAYAEADITLDGGREVAAPRTFAKMLEAASIGADDLVLDVNPGLGYSTAVLAKLAGAVVAAEPDVALAGKLQATVAEMDIDNVVVAEDEGPGDPANGPYDVIFVNTGVEEIPAALTDQLKDGGRLVAIFMDGPSGQCRVQIRAGNELSSRYMFDATAKVLDGYHRAVEFSL
ncbi:MAG: protein-L-isoaspartate O-methyltransferase [Pseudomonadota bacterium]